MYAVSPLRYPGAKWRLDKFIGAVLKENGLEGGHYVEPYAGGASLALSLLFREKVSTIYLNDLDRSVYAFWKSIIDHSEELIDRINSTPVNMDSWYAQKEVQSRKESASIISLGFSTFFLNRTNRSGILTAGVIGGKNQTGKWKIDARFNKKNLVERIKKVSSYKDRIKATQMDAMALIKEYSKSLPRNSIFYLDPPYFIKGQDLYMNAYEKNDHSDIACLVSEELTHPWIVSYDDVPEIRGLYQNHVGESYILRYSASTQRRGREIIFLGPGIRANRELLINA